MSEKKKLEVIRSLKYLAFASSAGVIEMTMFTLFDQLTVWNYWSCYLLALVMSVVWNFTLNRRFTFHSNNNITIAMIKVFIYYVIFTPLSTVLGNHLVENFLWNAYLVTAMSLGLNCVTEYLYQRVFVFGNSVDSLADKRKDKRAVVI